MQTADAQLGFGPALEDSVKLAVQASWGVMKADADVIGRALFAKLFARNPALLKNFGFRDVPNYIDSRALKVRAGTGGVEYTSFGACTSIQPGPLVWGCGPEF